MIEEPVSFTRPVLPLEIYPLIAEHLDPPSVIRFSMVRSLIHFLRLFLSADDLLIGRHPRSFTKC